MPTGSCLCGNLKYEFEGELVMKAICHCLICRKLRGTTFSTNIVVSDGNFKITSDSQPKNSYTDLHESGIKITRQTCTECGCAVAKKGTGPFEGTVIVQCGTLDDKNGLTILAKPDSELWVKHRVPWLAPIEGTQQCQEFS